MKEEKNQSDFDTLPKTDPFGQFEWKKKLNGDKKKSGKKNNNLSIQMANRLQ